MSAIKSFFFSLLITLCLQALACADTAPDLLLAKVYEQNIDVSQYWVSEKYDGVRAYWNGQQLMSRQGNVYEAPAWFTADFPQQPLDGELWIGRAQFERLLSTVSKQKPIHEEWQQVRYMVFELPESAGTFSERIAEMETLIASSASPYLKIVPQFRLESHQQLKDRLKDIIKLGGEGLMLHRADALYHTGRSDDLLKVKSYLDAEAKVLKHIPGKGKYHGMLGSLLVENDKGKHFKIGSGFSDIERSNPPPVGSVITYKYYGLTSNGIPRFASFLRIRGQ